MHRPLLVAGFVAVVLVSCSSGKKSATPPPTSFLFQTTTSSTLPATPVVARVLLPEKGSVQGTGGRGMVVALLFTAKDPGLLPADFRLGGALPSPAAAVKPGRNAAFPGLVVSLSTTGTPFGGPNANLANLFQIVSPSKQPDGSMQVSAVWTNAQPGFGADTDATLVAFTVAGNAPDTVSTNPGDMNPSSNIAEVSFHVSGTDTAAPAASSSTTTSVATSTSVRPTSTTARPATTVAPAPTTSRPATTVAPSTTVAPATTSTTSLLGGLLPGR